MRCAKGLSRKSLPVPATAVGILVDKQMGIRLKPLQDLLSLAFARTFARIGAIRDVGGAIYRRQHNEQAFVSPPRVIPSVMQRISSEALKLVQEKTPHFVEEVQQGKASVQGTRKTARLVVRLDRFEDDPFQLYACLWYASSEGVDVLFAAHTGQA